MRRLPVYFLVDVSDSMAGEPIQEAARGLERVIVELCSDPYALETVFASVIAFAGRADELVPLTDICLFKAPQLPIGSGTTLGKALDLLMSRISRDVRKTTASQKGDWKPIIFLFTDGAPTDDPRAAIKRWNDAFRRNAGIIAITFGDNADVRILEDFCDTVLTLKDTSAASFREFFRWVSNSLKVSSLAIAGEGKEEGRLAGYCINLEKARPAAKVDENFAILPVKCSSGRDLWLAKYSRAGSRSWNLTGTYVVEEKGYKAWSEEGGAEASLDLAGVDRIPDCPICHSSEGVVKCAVCGHLSCSPRDGKGVCPWCETPYGKLSLVDSMTAPRSRG